MWLTDLCIKRPVLTLMFYALVLVLGLRSLADIPIELFPEVEFPIVSVQTVFEGADPETVEEEVTKPLEDAISTVSGIESLKSVSQQNLSTVMVEFEVGTDLGRKVNDIRERVERAKGDLPTEAHSPSVVQFSFSAEPILFYGVTGPVPIEDLRRIVEEDIAEPLRQIDGVGDVAIVGGRNKELRIEASLPALAAHRMTFRQIEEAVQMNNLDASVGELVRLSSEQQVRVDGKIRSVQDFDRIPVFGPEGRSWPLSTFAQTLLGYERQSEIARMNGKEGVGVLLVKASKANTMRVVAAVKERMEALKRDLPPHVEVREMVNNSRPIAEALSDVQQAIGLGVLLATVIVYIFLYSLRGTLIVALAIPLSILFALIPMRFVGISINQMSMLGLALSVGSLVDDAIVVMENIFRHLQRGELPRVAALQGRGEIGAAAVAITFTNVVVYLPVAFMGGIIGMFFRDFGLTVTFSILASLIVSFTLTPSLAALMFRRGENLVPERGFFHRFDRTFNRAGGAYARLLALALRHRFGTICSAFLLLGVVAALFGPHLKGQFMPAIDQGRVGITVKMPEGTALAETHARIRRIEGAIAGFDEIASIYTTVGSVRGGFRGIGDRGGRYAQIVLGLKPKKTFLDLFLFRAEGLRELSDEDLIVRIRNRIAPIPAGDVRVVPIRGSGGGFGPPIEVILLGKDLDRLFAQAERVREMIAAIPGTVSPEVAFQKGEPEWTFVPDRAALEDRGMTVAYAADVLKTAVEGKIVSRFEENGEEYDVRLVGRDLQRASIRDLTALPLRYASSPSGRVGGGVVTVGDVGRFELTTTAPRIEREDKQRAITITSYLRPGVPEQQVQTGLQQTLGETPMPGIRVKWGGEAERRMESMGHLGSALKLSVVLIFILLASLYNHLLYPFIIMFSLPTAMAGVIVALVVTSTPMSIVTMIGIILLVGIVVNNAILLVDYTNTLRARGSAKDEALVESGRTRLRPILMTSFTLIFSLLPTALRIGPGAAFRAPMAITVIGGQVVSTLLTLLLVPCMYLVIDNTWEWLWKRAKRS